MMTYCSTLLRLAHVLEVKNTGLALDSKRVPPRATMRTASATIKGSEVMRMSRRRHCILCKPEVTGDIRFINKQFDVCLISEIGSGELSLRG